MAAKLFRVKHFVTRETTIFFFKCKVKLEYVAIKNRAKVKKIKRI